MINFKFKHSLFNKNFCFMFDGRMYERLTAHPKRIQFRVILSEDDYDYVTKKSDRKLFRKLKKFYESLKEEFYIE